MLGAVSDRNAFRESDVLNMNYVIKTRKIFGKLQKIDDSIFVLPG